uniref:UDP-N-acetylglucosamine--N-acetylmuramyl-(pentapeptide) pyrophosphoryl-undecaprenol N-acetylglucosamine transferase n=1 Tax=Cyanothece sp. (strain PCC 7425 / ATCC 29141) TaxID=395961 RepID=B8HMM5_CYAP4
MHRPKLLVAASGTGGHLFPAIAVAQRLSDYDIEWLGVANRLETRLVPDNYPLHITSIEGFQRGLGLGTLKILAKFIHSIWQTRQLLQRGGFRGVFTTGGYIAAPAIIAARSLGLATVLHDSNALPGKVTRWLSPWCSVVALGFKAAIRYLPRGQTDWVGTPVRSDFLHPPALDLPLPEAEPVIVVMGGSQGAVAVNQLVRQAAPSWLGAGAWIVHLTGENDPETHRLQHPHYLELPFYDQMAGLLQRADLVVSRAGAGSLTELAITATPSILIPYPYAAEDHQTYNAKVFAEAGAAILLPQSSLTAAQLEAEVLTLLRSPDTREQMANQAASLAVPDSAEKLAALIRRVIKSA